MRQYNNGAERSKKFATQNRCPPPPDLVLLNITILKRCEKITNIAFDAKQVDL
jgi:hypothetical protein